MAVIAKARVVQSIGFSSITAAAEGLVTFERCSSWWKARLWGWWAQVVRLGNRGRPGVPPLRHSGGASGFAVGADDPGGPRAHTVRPYEEEGELPRRAGEDTRPYGRADIETVSFFS